MTNWIFEIAPAKLNLALHVTGRRPDNYHTLESLVAFADIFDELSARPGVVDSLTIDGRFSGQINSDQSNLVLRAVVAFRARWPNQLPDGMEIRLTKNLPVAAGIGGGSSDAAAMLRILMQMAKTPAETSELTDLAAQLGADVPVCLQSTPRIMADIGENIGPPLQLPDAYLVLVNPMIATATKDVFARLKTRENSAMPLMPDVISNTKTLARWLKTTRNDLVQAACELTPEISEITNFLRTDQDCLFARMSGSGATVFALFETREQAVKGAQAARSRWPDYWVVSTRMISGNQRQF